MSSKKEEARMAPKTRRSLVPALRFPEFRDAGEWEGKKLSSIVNLISGLHLSPEEYSEVGDVPYFTGPSDFTNRTQEVSKWTGESTSIANENDTLITVKGSGVGEIWYLSLPAVAMGRQLMAVRTINGSSRFIFQFFLTKRTRFEDLASGNLIPGLSRGDILGLEARFPSFLEQQKIADCLSSIDDLITLEARKLDRLKAHKKGLMQQLFPAEGGTIPKLRFPEFREAGEWEEVYGKNLFKQVNDRNHEQDLPVLAITQENGAIPRDLINYHVAVTEKSIENYKVVQICDFIISLRSFQGGIEYSSYHGICSPAYVVLRRLIEGSDVYFKHYFKTERFISLLTKNLEGLRDGKMISYRQFSELLLSVPKQLEQQKIADCLSSLDDLIALQSQKLEVLKVHKKGLMQQLFPVSDEVGR